MRLIMMGTGPFAVPTFESLLDSEHDVAVLVTRPLSRKRTRGKPLVNPMQEVAERRGLEVLAPEDINSPGAATQLASLRPDLLVVCDYGQILSSEILAIAPLGGINLHGSLLPKYRGAAPVNWAIWNGDPESGVTVIHMTPKLDAGPILCLRSTPIAGQETAAELEPRLAQMGVEAVHEAIQLLADWDRVSPIGSPQEMSAATRAPRLKKTDGQVDWSRTAEQIANQVRALKPWPGTFTHWHRSEGEPLRLILDRVSLAHAKRDVRAGTVAEADHDQLCIATGEEWLSIDRVQPAGKRAMDAGEFLRGNRVRLGDRFGS